MGVCGVCGVGGVGVGVGGVCCRRVGWKWLGRGWECEVGGGGSWGRLGGGWGRWLG